MYDVIVEGTALGWVDQGSFPVSVDVVLTDSRGKVHHVIDKEPVMVATPLDADTQFPIRLGLRGTRLRVDAETVEVLLAYDMVTIEGASSLTLRAHDVHWM